MPVIRERGPAAKNLEVLLKGLPAVQGKVGWFQDAQYENGTPVAYIAAIQEFGSPKNSIPARSFMRTTISERRQEWAKIAQNGSKALLAGTATPEQVMTGIGLAAKGDIQKKIANIYDPELSPLTLAIRKYRLGLIKDMDPGPVGGKLVGILAGRLARGEIDTSGVSTKPLVEPAAIGGGVLINSIDVRVGE